MIFRVLPVKIPTLEIYFTKVRRKIKHFFEFSSFVSAEQIQQLTSSDFQRSLLADRSTKLELILAGRKEEKNKRLVRRKNVDRR